MLNVWMPSVGLPLLVLGVRLIMISSSLIRSRKAGQPRLTVAQTPWAEGAKWAIIGTIGIALGLVDYLLWSPQGQIVWNAGSQVGVLGMAQMIQARAQILQGQNRMAMEKLIANGALAIAIVGAALVFVYAGMALW